MPESATDQLAAIEARAQAATNLGEWETTRANDVVIYVPNGFGAYRIIAHADAKWDAEFIAHARTDVPALLATVREQQAKLEAVNSDAAVDRAAETIFMHNYPNGVWRGAPKNMRAPYLHRARIAIRAALTATEASE